MDSDGDRLEESIRAMRSFYPKFSLSGSPIGTGPVAVWKGWVRPLWGADELASILDDIANDRPVAVLAGGLVEHLTSCTARHERPPWVRRLKDVSAAYKLKVLYGGGRVHPRAYVIDPRFRRGELRHSFRDGAACAYPPWEDVWRCDEHTVVDFMDHVVVWLVKLTVWRQAGVWPGSEMDHESQFLLQSIHPAQQCWCGSGSAYEGCHRGSDQAAVRRDFEESIMRALRGYDVSAKVIRAHSKRHVTKAGVRHGVLG